MRASPRFSRQKVARILIVNLLLRVRSTGRLFRPGHLGQSSPEPPRPFLVKSRAWHPPRQNLERVVGVQRRKPREVRGESAGLGNFCVQRG